MKLAKPIFPKETNPDVAMSVLIPNAEAVSGNKLPFQYEFQGVSERTALGDSLKVDMRNRQGKTSSVKFSLKRDSFYHILPEYLFHPLDHYLGIEGDTEEFDRRYKLQEEKKNDALRYFKPFDQHYQKLRTDYQKHLNETIFSGNKFLSDFITTGYEVNLDNPYINAVYGCIPWLRDYRGNDDMIATALRFAFKGEADVEMVREETSVPFTENIHSEIEGNLDGLFCGPSFKEGIDTWKVFYHTEIGMEDRLEQIKALITEFSEFFTMWFLPMNARLDISFGDVHAAPQLTDNNRGKGVFLDYSTQLI